MRQPSQAGCWGSRSRAEGNWSAVWIAVLGPGWKVTVGAAWSGAAAGAPAWTRNVPTVRRDKKKKAKKVPNIYQLLLDHY